MGKAQVSIYASAYLAKSLVDAPLVELRDYLASRRIARRTAVHEPEDHFAALCELMRYLIAEQQAPLDEQRAVFEKYLKPLAGSFCGAVSNAGNAAFYRPAAQFTAAFFDLEDAMFRM